MKPTRIMTCLLSAALLGAVAAFPAAAGDRHGHGYGHGHGHHHKHRQQVTGYSGLPTYIPGLGTFSGAISGVKFKGNGIYFIRQGKLGKPAAPSLAPKAKIIHVGRGSAQSAFAPRNACSYEAGVCVIRP